MKKRRDEFRSSRKAQRPTPPPKPAYDQTLLNRVRDFLQRNSIVLASNDKLEELRLNLTKLGFFNETPLWYKEFYNHCLGVRLKVVVDPDEEIKHDAYEDAKKYHKELLGNNPKRQFLLGYSPFKPEELNDPENAFLVDLCQFLLGMNEKGSPEEIIEKLKTNLEKPAYTGMVRIKPEMWEGVGRSRNLASKLANEFPFGPEDRNVRHKVEDHLRRIEVLLSSLL